ncbi:RCC1 domain-containing protein [Candidatus Poriferisodalis sp.]|uniref:RCC1 domain-containing protein n=1 Tax=Candidatus Poriferisodalis sp. TaxID=3101277 RepID=UPI003B02D39D
MIDTNAMRIAAAVLALSLAVFGLSAAPVAAHPTPEPKCSGEMYAVVAAEGDAAMAELIASWQVLDTKCVVEPGDTDRIESHKVVVLGGTRAVPDSAVAGLNVIVRLAGADRLATARAVLGWIDVRAAASNAQKLAAGAGESCVIRSDKTIACWGASSSGLLDAPSGTYTAVAVGVSHACAIRTENTLVCWGDNDLGQLDAPAGSHTAVSVAGEGRAGYGYSCAIRSDGAIACWGNNEYGKADPPAGSYVDVAAGPGHSCAIRSDGAIACWGNNEYGKADPPAGSYVDVAAGVHHSCAIRSDKSIACWGRNRWGLLDAPAGTYINIDARGHSCAIRSDSTIACWGGVNVTGATDAPVGTYTSVTVGFFHSCAIRTDNTITCWGFDELGLLDVPEGLRAAA